MWGVSHGLFLHLVPWIRHSYLRHRLQTHLYQVYTCDHLLHLEGGLNRLHSKDIEQVICTALCIKETYPKLNIFHKDFEGLKLSGIFLTIIIILTLYKSSNDTTYINKQ